MPLMLDYLGIFPSEYVKPRTVDVWLPPGYQKNGTSRYPVIYMHDGQFVFWPINRFAGWGMRETMTDLIRCGKIPEVIVVGIWNTENRWLEYAPCKPVEMFFNEETKKNLIASGYYPDGDNYLKFIVNELKPFIDANYPVFPDCENTFLMGSSMGAIISLYGVCEYPDIFKGSGCLSTHWPLYNGVMIDYMEEYLPIGHNKKFYFDLGSESIDQEYTLFQEKADLVMRGQGYQENIDWITGKFDGDHSAASWGKRVHIPLEFLLN